MEAASWVNLFKQIPTNLHDTLVLLTTTGAEVMVQTILKLEEQFVVFRGRMSGTMDGGRIMIIPYDQIHTMAFSGRLLETDVQKVFGAEVSGTFAAPIELSKGKQLGEEEEAADDEIDDEVTRLPGEQLLEVPVAELTPQPTPIKPGNDKPVIPSQPSKSLLLARLRARLAGGPK